MKILINGVGGPTPRSIARTLHQLGNYADYELIGTDINKYALGLYRKDLFTHTYIIPRASDENYWDEIEAIIKKHQIDMAIVQPELEVLEWSRRAQTHELPCKVLLPDVKLVKALIDKATMTEHLEPHGVVPMSVRIAPDNVSIREIEEKLGFPFWIRST